LSHDETARKSAVGENAIADTVSGGPSGTCTSALTSQAFGEAFAAAGFEGAKRNDILLKRLYSGLAARDQLWEPVMPPVTAVVPVYGL